VTGFLRVPFAFKLLTDAVNTDAVLIIYLLFFGKIPMPFSTAKKSILLYSFGWLRYINMWHSHEFYKELH